MLSLTRSLTARCLFNLLLALPAATAAQTGSIQPERENLRALPRGVILAEIMRGTELPLGAARDGWREALLEGWIWSASVRSEERDGHDLVVSAPGGENLRFTPNGDIIARLRTGMLLDRVGAEGNWLRVRRSAWIWEASLRVDEPAPSPAPTAAATPPPAPAADAGAARTSGAADAGAAGGAIATPSPGGGREFSTVGPRGLVVLARPAGDTLGRIHQGASVEVLARDGDWARVRVDGWVFTGALPAHGSDADVLRDLDRESLQRDSDRYHGRLVEWTVQFISLQEAETFRTDFRAGEPFVLARGPGDDAGFVYLAVPPERLAEVKRLDPLQRVRVLGRVRLGRSPLTDAPVIDLLEILRRDDAERR